MQRPNEQQQRLSSWAINWRNIEIIENTENTNPNYDFFCIFSLSHISHDNLHGGIKSDNLMFFEPVITNHFIQCLDFYTIFHLENFCDWETESDLGN